MFLTNVAAAVAFDAQPQIDDARKDKNNIGILNDYLVLVLTLSNGATQTEMVQCIINEIKEAVVPIRIEQSIHRNLSSGNTKFHHNPKVGILDITKFINRSVIE